jgi:uncharacterized membrane protein (UPF0182 family)
MGAINPWTAVLWWSARDTGVYVDPLFGRDLAFYFYKLPFYQMLLGWATAFCVIGLAVYSLALLLGSEIVVFMERPEEPFRVKAAPARVLAALASGMRRGGALFIVLFAAGKYLDRYALLYSQHQFLFGADYVDARLGLPLYWAQIVLLLGLAVLLLAAPRPRFMADEELGLGAALLGALPKWLAAALAGGAAVVILAPPLLQATVRSLYVQPNELTLERPYIEHHIAATLAAFNLASNAREEPFAPRATETLDMSRQPDVAENIRLWDWEPFRNNVTQRQALRPYYAFPEVDTDRYSINGRMRQVLIAARSLETDLLPANAQTWVNLNLQYTHGYGAVAALVNSATEEGAPEMMLRDAPPQSGVPAFKITRPELYFDSLADAPVFVDSDQQEFDYPKGDDNAYNTYRGTAGIPVGTPAMRLAAAVAMGDWNILLTHYLTKNSRLLLHRQVSDRVRRLAPFLTLDPDPYLVIDDSGRLFWMIDAYTMTDRHPYSQTINVGGSAVNYIRNSVKITVDAYNGTPARRLSRALARAVLSAFRDARRPPAPHSLPSAHLQRPGRDLPNLPYAGPAGLLQQGGSVGRCQADSHAGGHALYRALLRDAAPARRETSGVRADASLHEPQPRQPHCLDRRAVRSRALRRDRVLPPAQGAVDLRPATGAEPHRPGPGHQ